MEEEIVPVLHVEDAARAVAWYARLGFVKEWEHQFEPGFPVVAEVTRDGLSLFLTEHAGDCQVDGAAYIFVDDVDALYREITARGVSVLEPPEDAPWGGREMSVLDPDGNRLRFATRQDAQDA